MPLIQKLMLNIKALLWAFLFLSLHSFSFERVVSLSPSTTELMKDLGQEKKLVGISSFCEFDRKVSKVGTNFDVNYEKLLGLNTDLVIFPKTNSPKLYENLQKMKIKYIDVDHNSLEGIKKSILELGRLFKIEKKSKELLKNVAVSAQEKRSSALFVMDTVIVNGKIKDLYISGAEGLYGEILSFSGLENSAKDLKGPYPLISIEKLLLLAPKNIIMFESSQLVSKFKKIKGLKSNYIEVEKKYRVPGISSFELIKKLSESF